MRSITRSFSLALGLAGLVAMALAAPSSARTVGQSGGNSRSGLVTLRVCNHISDTVLVGVSYMPVGRDDWLNNGWTPVHGGQCKDLFQTENPYFYARAEVRGDSSRSWGSDINQCVEYPGPYNFYTGTEDTTCPGNSEAQEFTTFHSDGRPVFVWDLNP